MMMINQSREMRWVGHVAHMEEMRNLFKIFARKPERKRPLVRQRHRWENNTKMDLSEIGLEGVDCIHLVQDRGQWWATVNMVTNLWVP
jgi:hypothetical protein